MKKSFLAVSLVFILLSSPINVNAQSNCALGSGDEFQINDSFVELLNTNQEELYEKYDNIVDIQKVEVNEEQFNDQVKAYEYNGNKIVQELDCDITLNKVLYSNAKNAAYTSEASTSTIYILSAQASSKTSEDSKHENGVTLFGCIGWEDVLGPVNEFKYVSGGRRGSISGDGYFQAGRGSGVLCNGYFEDDFRATSDEDDTTGTQFSLIVRSSTTNGNTVLLEVNTSIFD